MAIEFPCPTCRQLVRTPDAAAGKKGQCPGCGTVVIIPAPIQVVGSGGPSKGQDSTARGQTTEDRGQQAPAAAATIEFACPACRQVVRTPASAAGKRGKCPSCQALVQIPASGPSSVPSPQAAPKPSPRAEPRAERSPPEPARPAPPASPLPQPPAQPYGGRITLPAGPPSAVPSTGPAKPPSIPVLTPLGRQPVAGLTPLPPAVPGLTPLATGPVPGLTPLPADPLVELTPSQTLPSGPGAVVNPLNPYSPPLATAYDEPAYKPRMIHDRGRKGLPWEYDPSMDTFGDTMHLVLGSPREAFQLMRRSGGIVNPMTYFIIGGILGQIPSAIYSTIIRAIVFASFAEGPFPVEFVLTMGAIELIGGIIGVFISGAIGMFISAAIYHACLVLVGGANAGYEATYRALCFGLGSIAVLNAIPVVGPLIGFILMFAVLIHAFTHTHEIDGGKAAIAVFLPLFLFCCCLLPFAFLSLGGGLLR